MSWEAVIGLEVHVQLRTATKILCRCANRFGAEPNTLVCPVCLGYPGALPVLNRQAVDLAVLLALALGCRVPRRSRFARKNYFYPDLPKGYQISQYDEPLAEGGELPLTLHEKRVRIHRLHLEEDAGKLLHELPGGAALRGQSLVDFNRCGVPLVEIVSEPDLATAAEAADYLQTLHQVLLYTGTSDGNMEEGSLRCDANVSVRPRGETRLGTKVEIKNLNSFRNVARAVEHEIGRQIELLESGERVVQETRGFDAETGATRPQRGKEEAHDYRYFPEPDLLPLAVGSERLEELRRRLPELPWDRRRRLREDLGLSADDARELATSRELADYFEAALAVHRRSPKAVANWVMGEVRRALRERRVELDAAPPPDRLGRLVAMVEAGALSHSAAKEVFAAIWESGEEPAAALARLGLAQVSDEAAVQRWVEEVIEEFPAQVAQLRGGKTQVLGFLVGQVMKRSGGRAEPRLVQELVRRSLAALQNVESRRD
jgi:aspartyl-tRNA(Asn)/glutamyl-tRNA(Gln) amidotransferase subunit B